MYTCIVIRCILQPHSELHVHCLIHKPLYNAHVIAGCIEIYMPLISNHTKYINQKLFVNSFHLMYRKVVLKTQKKPMLYTNIDIKIHVLDALFEKDMLRQR